MSSKGGRTYTCDVCKRDEWFSGDQWAADFIPSNWLLMRLRRGTAVRVAHQDYIELHCCPECSQKVLSLFGLTKAGFGGGE